jgi:hypothetical protein
MSIVITMMGSRTMSLRPVSMRSAMRASFGMARDRSAFRSITGSVEASAAPRMIAAGAGSFSKK